MPVKFVCNEHWTIPKEQRNGIYKFHSGIQYWANGKLHREDGPASDYYGDKSWYINNKLHRLDGPAIEYCNGRKEYWIKGEYYSSKEEFEKVAYMYKNGLQDYL